MFIFISEREGVFIFIGERERLRIHFIVEGGSVHFYK